MSQATDYAGVEEAAGFQPSGVSRTEIVYSTFWNLFYTILAKVSVQYQHDHECRHIQA
jgi:hypothetical protein